MANTYEYPLNHVGERVGEILEENKSNSARLAISLRRERKTIYSRLHGTSEWSQNDLIRLCLLYNVNANWLLFGEGPKYRNTIIDN